jgi:hypothetical protein
MKKLLVVMLAMAIAISFGSMAMAKNGLSVELGLAYNPNGADMGATILKDGEEGAGTGLFGDVVMSENQFLAVKKSKILGAPLIKSADDDGAMSGINTTLRVRYDFLDAFFVRLGFVYDQQIAGGDDSFKITDNVGLLAAYLTSKGVNGADNITWGAALAGGKVTQEWTYGYWAIPVTVGINVPVTEKFNLYAGIGLTYYSGYWQLKEKVPQGYMIGDYNRDGDINATDLAAAAAGKEKVKFEASGIGINWTVGASVVVYQDISIFLEIDTTMAADMSDSEKLKTNQGKMAFSSDNLYYPVSLSTQLIRFGASYKLPLEI